jgi:hypothetical protein
MLDAVHVHITAETQSVQRPARVFSGSHWDRLVRGPVNCALLGADLKDSVATLYSTRQARLLSRSSYGYLNTAPHLFPDEHGEVWRGRLNFAALHGSSGEDCRASGVAFTPAGPHDRDPQDSRAAIQRTAPTDGEPSRLRKPALISLFGLRNSHPTVAPPDAQIGSNVSNRN